MPWFDEDGIAVKAEPCGLAFKFLGAHFVHHKKAAEPNGSAAFLWLALSIAV